MMNPNDIPGWINERHQLRLQQTLSELKPGARILEVGCGFGRSTVCILNHMPPSAQLTTVDTFAHLKPKKMRKKIIKGHERKGITIPTQLRKNTELLLHLNQREMWDRMVNAHPRRAHCTVYEMSSADYIQQNPHTTYDMVYLDGDHSYPAVSMELNHYQHCAVISGDDYGVSHPGVIKAVDELRVKYPERTWQTSEQHVRSGFWSLRI